VDKLIKLECLLVGGQADKIGVFVSGWTS